MQDFALRRKKKGGHSLTGQNMLTPSQQLGRPCCEDDEEDNDDDYGDKLQQLCSSQHVTSQNILVVSPLLDRAGIVCRLGLEVDSGIESAVQELYRGGPL